MIRVIGCSILIGVASLMLSACQLTQESMDRIRIKQAVNINNNINNALVYCSGAQNCEFARLDHMSIVDAQSKRINPEAIQNGWVRLTGQPLSQNGLYLDIPAKQHELVLRFYPISTQRAEVFHVIHQFKPKHHYSFKMYRQRNSHTGSLLNVSAPTPLCVDLMQEQRLLRRFCRPFNAVTGVSEFVEQKI